MTNVSPFPFLRLPSVAQDEIQKFMNNTILFKLSMTCTKAKRVVQSYTGSHSFKMAVFLANDFKVYFGNLEIKMVKQKKQVKTERLNTSKTILEHLMNYQDAISNNFVSVWEGHHMKVAMKHLIEYLAEVFNGPSISPFFDGQSHLFVINVIKLIKKLNLKMKDVTVQTDFISDELHDFVLNECRDAPELYVACQTTDDFGNEFTPSAPFQNDELTIAEAKWVTVSHLNELFIDVKALYLEECRFNRRQIVEFLQKWIQGCDLEYANLSYKGSLNLILETLVETEVPHSMSVFHIRVNNKDYGQQSVINICQKKGKNASLFVNKKTLILTTKWEKKEINEEDVELDDVGHIHDVQEDNDNEDEEVVEVGGGNEENSDDEGLENQ